MGVVMEGLLRCWRSAAQVTLDGRSGGRRQAGASVGKPVVGELGGLVGSKWLEMCR